MSRFVNILSSILATTIILGIAAIPFYFIWNYTIPHIFGLPYIEPLDSFLLLLLSWVFLGTMRILLPQVAIQSQPMGFNFDEMDLENYDVYVDETKKEEEDEK